jgi:hypothetical protein
LAPRRSQREEKTTATSTFPFGLLGRAGREPTRLSISRPILPSFSSSLPSLRPRRRFREARVGGFLMSAGGTFRRSRGHASRPSSTAQAEEEERGKFYAEKPPHARSRARSRTFHSSAPPPPPPGCVDLREKKEREREEGDSARTERLVIFQLKGEDKSDDSTSLCGLRRRLRGLMDQSSW